MYKVLKWLWQQDDGQDLTEYALLLVLITFAAMSMMHSLATAIFRSYIHVVYVLIKHHMPT